MQLHLRHRYTGHIGSVYCLCDDQRGGFFSGAGDRIVARWDLENPADGEVIVRAGDAVYSLCLLSDRNQLLVGNGKGGVHIIDLYAGKEEHLLQLHDTTVFSIVASPDKKHICTTGGDGLLNIVQCDNFQTLQRLRLTENKLRTIVFHPVEPIALAGCGDGTIVHIDTSSWQLIQRIGAHAPGFSVNCICFSPDGKHFLTGSRDAHLHLYESESLKLLTSIPAHNYAIYAIFFDPSGHYFATASRDKTVKLWDYKTMQVVARLEGNDGKGHINSVNTLLWFPGGQLLSGGDDRAIQLWQP
jgi:WD40 repeat protein